MNANKCHDSRPCCFLIAVAVAAIILLGRCFGQRRASSGSRHGDHSEGVKQGYRATVP